MDRGERKASSEAPSLSFLFSSVTEAAIGIIEKGEWSRRGGYIYTGVGLIVVVGVSEENAFWKLKLEFWGFFLD